MFAGERSGPAQPVTTSSLGYGDGVNRRSQIAMSEAETAQLLDEARTMTLCSYNHDGTIHAVAMWYGLFEGCVAVQTKAKSQKALNLRRDPRVTCLVELGEAYGELRGVELVGLVEPVEDPTRLFEIGVAVFERHFGPYEDARHRSEVEALVHNRIGFKILPMRAVTWDHRKLGSGT